MDFEKLCMIFTMQEPYYGILLSAMERFPTKSLDTIGVTKSGNVFRLYYNPEFMASMPTDTALEILKHECLHVAFNHFSLWEGRASPDVEEMRNTAADLEVNSYVNKQKLKPAAPVLAEQFGWKEQLGTLEYFSRLEALASQAQQPQQGKAQNPTQPCNGGQGNAPQPQQTPKQSQSQNQQSQSSSSSQQTPSSNDAGNFIKGLNPNAGNQLDNHSIWPECDSELDKQVMQQLVDELLVFAAEEVEKAQGDIPGEMKVRIDKIRKKPKPIADWRRYVRRYLGNEFSEVIKKSKKRESRRFPGAAGNRKQRKANILVAVDTSGSVSMPEYIEFFGQIKTIKDRASIHVLECDVCIEHEYDFTGIVPTDLHGGGGTDFSPVIRYFKEHIKQYDTLVYFTDGYANIPQDTPKETLWVISSNGNHDRARYKVNGASVVIIPKQNNQ